MGNILKKYNLTKAQWEVVGGAITGDTLPIGSIIPFGGTEAPTGWLICDGSMLNRTTYKELFAAIGTNFGTDGPGNFYIPDLRGKVAVGQNASETEFNTLGKTGGEKTHTLTIEEMPAHNHNINWQYTGGSGTATAIFTYSGNTIGTTSTGGDQPHNNLQPYQVTNYIIKAFQSSGVVAQVSNTKSTSTTDTYSCEYVNKKVDGVVLYENSAGTTSNITLNEAPSGNYNFIEIYGISSDSMLCYTKVKNDDYGKTIALSTFALDGSIYLKLARLSLSGVNLTFVQNSEFYKANNTSSGGYNASGDFIKITKVIGYK